jgi:hypothetical protein
MIHRRDGKGSRDDVYAGGVRSAPAISKRLRFHYAEIECVKSQHAAYYCQWSFCRQPPAKITHKLTLLIVAISLTDISLGLIRSALEVHVL